VIIKIPEAFSRTGAKNTAWLICWKYIGTAIAGMPFVILINTVISHEVFLSTDVVKYTPTAKGHRTLWLYTLIL
jgi:hypothetical protein